LDFVQLSGSQSRQSDDAIDLSKREQEIFRWIATGKSDWEISRILGISAKTANYHVENVKRKCAVGTRIQALVVVVRTGALDG
jgi:DNA-binding CsgD family transcriptional regulator